MNKQQELIESMHCGLFATPNSIAAAYQQADDYIKSQNDSAYLWVLIYGILNAYHAEFKRLNNEETKAK